MTLLGGLFSRKKKRETSLHSTEPPDSAQSSPTTASYVRVNPSARGPSPPSSKLRLAFGRKKASDIDTRSHPTRASTDTNSVESRRLRPPPSRSAIFAAYGDPSGALSTRSLPSESTSNPPRRPSLFAWAKSSSPSESSAPSSTLVHDSPNNSDANSFNLKAFRHVSPPSPTNVSNSSLAPPKPRPRGLSTNSDSSQRISVAAFREAQARRSTAGSPVPDFRSPSPIPSPSITSEQARPRPSRSAPQQRPRSSIAVTSNSDSDDETSSSENDSEDDTIQNSIYSKPKSKAKSEIGHARPASNFPPYRAPKSHLGHSPSPQQHLTPHQLKNKVPDLPSTSLGVHTAGVRPRASVSASALSPTPAAKRASVLVASDSKQGLSAFLSDLIISRSLNISHPRPSLPIDAHSSLTSIEAIPFQRQPRHPHCPTIRLGLGRRRASCHPHGPQETRECHVVLFQYPFPLNRQRHYAFNNFP